MALPDFMSDFMIDERLDVMGSSVNFFRAFVKL